MFDLLNICDGEGGLRIPYYMKGENQPTRYNDKTVILPQEEKKVAIASSDFDPFKVGSLTKISIFVRITWRAGQH